MTRPINADVPVDAPAKGGAGRPPKVGAPEQAVGGGRPQQSAPRPPRPKRRRRSIPAALKAIAGLVVLAVVFVLAAVLGGGSGEEPASDSPAPVSVQPGSGDETPVARATAELGYPAFATSNTTRVGGSDPASNAAGVALATYPSTDSSQRPDAVTLIEAGDWQSGIAASVLMADPLGAPLLIVEADGVPEQATQALDALEPQGSSASNGAEAFAVGEAAVPAGLLATRVQARSPAATAAAIARLRDRLFKAPPRHIVVAPIAAAEFAMPAAAWAARSGDPVLFAGASRLPRATAAVLRRHRRAPVYVLGPSSALSSDVVREIAKISGQVRRVSGEDPIENAIALARYDDGDFGWNVNDPGHGFVVARSESPLDAAAAAPLSASGTWGPLLLTDSADTLPPPLRGYLLDVKPGYTTDPTRAFYNHVWVIGDEDAIDVSQQAEIDELAELARIGGGP